MRIDKPPFIEDIQPAHRTKKILKSNFVTGKPSWGSKVDNSGTNSVTYFGPANGNGNRIEVGTSGLDGDDVEFRSDFGINFNYWDRVIVKFYDFKVNPYTGQLSWLGFWDGTGDQRLFLQYYVNAAGDDGYLSWNTKPNASTAKVTTFLTVNNAIDLSSPVDMMLDIDMISGQVRASMEHTTCVQSDISLVPDDTVYLMFPRLKAQEAAVKQASISKIELEMWQQQ